MIRVLIADDQQLFVELLEIMLQASSDITVVAGANNGLEAFEKVKKYVPDVVLMDIFMPEHDGLEAIREIRKAKLNTKILVLSSSTGQEDVSEAIRQGADGYIPKSIGKEELILAIKTVHMGMEVLHKDIREKARSDTQRTVRRKGDTTIVMIEDFEVELSARDLEIIQMIIDGKTTGEMARELFLAEGRIRNIITELISKLMLKDRTQLAVFAMKNQLV